MCIYIWCQVDEEDDAASSGDEDEMDDKMGDIGDSDLREKLDDKMWGDDDKEDEDKEENKEVSYLVNLTMSELHFGTEILPACGTCDVR